jgi:hypothetical protein
MQEERIEFFFADRDPKNSVDSVSLAILLSCKGSEARSIYIEK